jgi:hypothetical protein
MARLGGRTLSIAEPRWDRDLAYGKQGELLIEDYLEWVARRNGRVETKRKRRLDFELYVETECDKGRTGCFEPSGLNVTQADVWAFAVGNTGLAIFIPTGLLRLACSHKSARRKEEQDGSCPTRGYLVNLAAILAIARNQEGAGWPRPSAPGRNRRRSCDPSPERHQNG